MISLVNVDEDNVEAFEKEAKIMVVEILRGEPYSCLALKPGKNKGVVGEGKFENDFDISTNLRIQFDYCSFSKTPHSGYCSFSTESENFSSYI